MMPNLSNFRELLKNTLYDRSQRNPEYSLRQFAKDLEIDPSTLVKYLNGKRVIGPKVIKSLGEKLHLSPEAINNFTRKYEQKRSVKTSTIHRDLGKDTYTMLESWEHTAIRMLILLKDFQSDPEWIANKLGITLKETETAIKRLLLTGYLRKDKDGNLYSVKKHTTFRGMKRNQELDQALTKRHQRILAKAQDSLDYRDEESQIWYNYIFPANKMAKKEQFIERFDKCRDAVRKSLTKGDEREEVYCLAISFFPLTEE